MYKKIAITNRNLCSDLPRQIEKLHSSDYDIIILREKDLGCDEYLKLAKKAIEISDKIILHTYIDVCEELNYKRIHLPYRSFIENAERIKDYEIKGVSIHSVDEAVRAAELGADYVTASHIFKTACKAGLEPKGTKWLSDVCKAADIEVYALGGIKSENINECINAGADGVCMMSEAMYL